MRRALVVMLALAGCAQYASVATTNAPGTIDLATPLPNENGDPARFEKPTDPGSRSLVIFAMPTFLGGTGRLPTSKGAFEPGLEVRFERHDSGTRWHAAHLAATFGVGFYQFYEDQRDHFGALHAELNVRFPTAWGVMPTDIGVGPVAYPVDSEFGGQLSVRVPFLLLRFRYLQDNGFEFWGGYEMPIPFIFTRSK